MAAIDLKALVGAAIRSERTVLHISQEELAYRAHLHRTYVSDVERGARNPSIRSIEKLACALKIPVPKLFERASHSGAAKPVTEMLLVENDSAEVRRACRAFAKLPMTNPLHVVRNGKEALSFILATGQYRYRCDVGPPEIVLLDLDLPDQSALEVLRQIKTNQTVSHLVVLILTTSNNDRRLGQCRQLGAANHMVKPFRFENFCEATASLGLSWTMGRTEADQSNQGANMSRQVALAPVA
jgi:CheY-like chemotaxis protein